MAPDQMTATLLTEYKEMAERLRRGEVIPAVDMSRYHGLTGLILVNTVLGLWSRDQLSIEIEAKIKAHCDSLHSIAQDEKERRHTAATPFTWTKFFADNAKVLIICVTIVITSAVIFNQLQKLGEFVNRVQTTRNIIEVK